MLEPPLNYRLSLEKAGEDGVTLHLSGRIDVSNAGIFFKDIERLVFPHQPRRVRLDLTSVSYLDSAGAAAILKAQAEFRQKGIAFSLENLPSSVEGLLNLLDLDTLFRAEGPSRPGPLSPVARIGDKAITMVRDVLYQVAFIGELILAFRHTILHPRQARCGDKAETGERVGVDALPIVCLINFLVGLTVGFQSALTLRQFGASIYLADMVALGMVRELGPLMTAILVAGRSGSAFAAEIGTMKVSEEVDVSSAWVLIPPAF